MTDDAPPLPFEDLPPPPKREWRKYTAAVWEQEHPDQAEFCLHLVREELILSVSEIGRRIAKEFNREYNGGLRNVITAFLSRKLTEAERNSIQQARLFFARADAVEKTQELVEKANAKGDLGAVAMAMKLTHDVGVSVSGAPSQIKEVRVVIDDLEAIRARAKQKVIEAQVVEMLPEASAKLPISNVQKEKVEVKK